MRLTGSACLFLIVSGLFGQTSAGRPEFEAAVVKPYKAEAADESGHALPGGELSLGNVTMTDLLQFAYSVREDAIAGKPAWFRTDHFDVVAKAPPGAPLGTLRLMMQSLLFTEFKLLLHQEMKPQDAFALVIAKGGPKLKTAAAPVPPGCKRSAPAGLRHVDCYNMSMAGFAERLPNEASTEIDRAVVDLTGITGTYDMQLDWVWNAQTASEGPTIFQALPKQLGLTLDHRKLLLPVVVIDHVERLAEPAR
jgi:uncharacterized protein (TIGR03435 family)